MNEERNSRYLNLINELLSCPFSEVSAILNANQGLIDAGLVHVIEQVAAMKEEKGARYSAKFLIDVARQLAEELGLSLSTPTSAPNPNPDPQHTFLIQVLQAIAMSNGDPSVVYPVLKATPDKLDDNFAQVLRNCVADALPSMESLADVENFAKLISYFSNLIQQFPLGNRARNLEIAIAGYEIVTPVVTREASPELWATLQICLGVAYLSRILGKRADNLEQAITCLNQALLVHTRDTSPELWAGTQNNLAAAYLYRIRGERADNLEQAITRLNQALQVRTRDVSPKDWAMTQNNLGIAYLYRILGERADNLEQAIARLNQALQVRTRDVSPKDWADTQINLGIAYLYRVLGERADNLEQAINCYYQALLEYTREDFPEKWAHIQNNLAFTYNKRILWKREDNLEQAIKCYHQALLVFTCDAFPEKWAETQNNLGAAYNERILGERTDNLEQAINCHQQALLVLTCEDFPEKWAINQYDLGLAYINLSDIRGDRGEANLRTSAIRCFTEALQIFNRDAFPQNYAETLFNLGIAYQKDNQLQLAHDTFELAIDTVKSLRGKTVSGDEAKQKLAEYYNELYHRMVEVCLALNNPSEAIEYVERSKARNLVELLCERDHYPKGATQEICNRLDQLRRDIRAEQQRLDIGKRINNTNSSSPVIAQGFIEVFPQELRPHLSGSFAPFIIDRTRLNELKQQLDRLIEDTIQPIDPRFSLTQKVGSISFKDIQKLISDDQTVIIEWYITRAGFETFIITRHSLQRLILPTPADDLKALIGWVNEYIAAYAQEKELWIDSLASRLNRLAEILHLEDILKLVPNTCLRLILIPHRYLHLFPLHALPVAGGNLLLDRFPNGVGYAPSCQLLKLAKDQEQHRPDFSHLFAIQNPTRLPPKPLLGSQLEVDRICQHFDPDHSIVLAEAEATEVTLRQRMNQLCSTHCVHFSCHGVFKPEFPLESALLLADPEGKLGADANLTLGKIFEKLYLNQCRLVTFSACESGMTDPTSISDEYIGLPSGFLYAGSLSIVSTLWRVNPLATTLLMVKFYKNLKQFPELKAGDVALALKKAQTWLRTLTSKKLARIQNNPKFQRWVEQAFENLPKRDRKKFNELLDTALKRQPCPFANPYYWSAFVATGL